MTTHDPEALLAHQAWMRRLAASLVREAGEADDVVQEAWVAALETRGPIGDLGAWLATVVKNSARSLRRGATRRAARAASRARPEGLPGSDEVVARLQEERVLLAELEALEEPYRTTLLLRFHEELAPRAIARRMQVPVETVKTRLKRGLARLRARLEEHHGGRESFLAALVPLLRPGEGALLPTGILLMKKPLEVLTLALVLGGGALGWHYWPRAERVPQVLETSLSAAEVPLQGQSMQPSTARESVREARTEQANGVRAAETEQTEPELLRLLPGRVFAPEGRPLAGLSIGQRAAPERAVTSDAEGRFALPAESGDGPLVVLDAGWTTIFYGTEEASEAAERVLVAAPVADLEGLVVDELGTPVQGVELRLEPPAGFRARFPAVLDYSARRHWVAISDELGRFFLADAARIDGSTLDSERAGFVDGSFPLGFDGLPLRLVLTPLADAADDLRGRVVDAEGDPVEGASVACGEAAARSDARGEFTLTRAELGDERLLSVVKRGQRPVRHELAEHEEYVLVRLAGPALTLSGRVRFDDGAPVPHARVWVADPSWFGTDVELGMDCTAEGLAVTTLTRTDLADLWQGEDVDPTNARFHALSLPMWAFVRADDEGRFELGGLAERAYTLRAMDERTLQTIESGPLAAGSGAVELVLPRSALWPRLAGRVLDTDGAPVAGASLWVNTTGLVVDRGSYSTYRGETRGEEAVTDAEGRFELANVPFSAALAVTGDHIERAEFGSVRTGGLERAIAGRPEGFTIVARHRYHLRIEAEDPAAFDSVVVLDAAGTVLWCERIEGWSTYGRQEIELVDGKSGSWNLPPEARTLVLRKAGVEQRRLELFLQPRIENLIVP